MSGELESLNRFWRIKNVCNSLDKFADRYSNSWRRFPFVSRVWISHLFDNETSNIQSDWNFGSSMEMYKVDARKTEDRRSSVYFKCVDLNNSVATKRAMAFKSRALPRPGDPFNWCFSKVLHTLIERLVGDKSTSFHRSLALLSHPLVQG